MEKYNHPGKLKEWHLLAIMIASFCTFVYVVIQLIKGIEWFINFLTQ